MSQTKFDTITRSALWTSYNNICFYCNRPLDWDDLHIDHIIPEYFASDTERFEQIKTEYELDIDFDLNSLCNLVPTHGKCNLRKNDEVFVKPTTLYYLGLTRRNITKIGIEIQKLKTRKNKGQIISKLQSALATNLIDTKELQDILLKVKQDNWIETEIKLPIGVKFIDEVYDIFYLKSDYSILYDKKVLIGSANDYINLVNDKSKIINISTLREWQNAKEAGFFPMTTVDIKMSDNFSFFEEFIEVMYKAKMPKFSFVSEPWIEIDMLDYLSPNILHDFNGRLSNYAAEGVSVGDLVRQGIIIKNENGIFKISLEFEGMETSLIEQFRADFNNDGIEDIFVRGWARAVGGTLGYGFTTILTRYSDNHLIEEIKFNK